MLITLIIFEKLPVIKVQFLILCKTRRYILLAFDMDLHHLH